jgi:hypothetical protein
MGTGYLVMNRTLAGPDGSYWVYFRDDPSGEPTFPKGVRVVFVGPGTASPEWDRRMGFVNWAEFCARHGADGLT